MSDIDGSASAGPGDGRSTFGDRLNHLFEVVRPAGRPRPYSNPEVARAISEQGEVLISPQYLWALRNGTRDNPTLKQIDALAAFFGVPPAYFLSAESAVRIDEQLALLVAARDADLREIMQRSTGLSGPDRQAVLHIIRSLRGGRAE
jgi:ESX-1-secreted protein regulator